MCSVARIVKVRALPRRSGALIVDRAAAVSTLPFGRSTAFIWMRPVDMLGPGAQTGSGCGKINNFCRARRGASATEVHHSGRIGRWQERKEDGRPVGAVAWSAAEIVQLAAGGVEIQPVLLDCRFLARCRKLSRSEARNVVDKAEE